MNTSDAINNKIRELNNELFPKWIANDILVNTPKESIEVLELFDLLCVNVLLHFHKKYQTEIPLQAKCFSELLFSLGLQKKEILDTHDIKQWSNDLIKEIPSCNRHLFQFLIHLYRKRENHISFEYLWILLFFLTIPKIGEEEDFARSRLFVILAHQFGCIKQKASHAYDVQYDSCSILSKLKRIVVAVGVNRDFSNEEYIRFMMTSLQQFSIMTIATVIKRDCTWPIFRIIGDEVLAQQLTFHQKITNTKYSTLFKSK